jgi:hypothetical protein
MYAISKGWKIRPVLATPPDGKPLNNPQNLSAEQVGVGRRLTRKGEKPTPGAQVWVGLVDSSGEWQKREDDAEPYYAGSTYRLPLSVPWPEAKPQTTKQAPLGPEDVPPGTVLRGAGSAQNYDGGWCIITSCSRTGIRIWRECDSNQAEITWQIIKDINSEINRSIPLTGKWDAHAWEPCSKEVQA